jgi:hypothetical protein
MRRQKAQASVMTNENTDVEYLHTGKSIVDYDRKALFHILAVAEAEYERGNYKNAADSFRSAAESYRKIGGVMQKELLDERSAKHTLVMVRDVQAGWIKKFRRPQKPPIGIDGLTEALLWNIVSDLQKNPLYDFYFEYQYNQMLQQGDIMTWKRRAQRRWLSIFGFTRPGRSVELSIAEEVIAELVLEKAILS